MPLYGGKLNAMCWLAAVLVLCPAPTPGATTLAPSDIMVLTFAYLCQGGQRRREPSVGHESF
jgi:hypothetical protein